MNASFRVEGCVTGREILAVRRGEHRLAASSLHPGRRNL